MRESDRAGRRTLAEVVQKLIGVRIDHYAEINLIGFYSITEAIGGVEVCLKRDVVDPDSGSDFKAGRQLISGADALSFVRQRHGLPNGDLDRIVRQQVFMAAVAKKVLSTDVLTNRNAITELRATMRQTMVIDAGWDVLDFALQLREVAVGNVEFVTIPVVDPARIFNGKSVVTVDEARVREFTAGLLDGSAQPSQPSLSPAAPLSFMQPSPSTSVPAAGEPDTTITADGITCVN